MIIKDIACCERPYEKAIEYGIETLSDAELIATIIRTGTKELSSIDLAHKILNCHHLYKGLHGLNYINRDELMLIKGIGNTKATQILALTEISSRMSKQILKKDINFNNPNSIASYYQKKCKYLKKERTYMMMFNTSHMLIKEVMLSEGTVNQTLISPREIFIEALKYESVNIVLIHNHPSGSPEPSKSDIEATLKIRDAGKLIDINLSDHIIVGGETYISMYERGII